MAGLVGAKAAAFAAWLFPATVLAQLASDSYNQYGGRYAANCASPSGPRVVVTSSTLMVEQGTQRITGRSLQAAHSYFGNSSPPNFVVALLSEAGRGLDLTGFIYTDRAGRYLQLDGAPRVRQALGGLVNTRFRDCQARGGERFATAPPPGPMAAPRGGLIAGERRPPSQAGAPAAVGPVGGPLPPGPPTGEFRKAYLRALGPLSSQYWLTHWEGPIIDERNVRIGGVDYVLKGVCKAHDCGDNNMVMVYSPAQGTLYGKASIATRPAFFGAPPPAMQQELERLWRGEWRKNQ